jgi:hypothetical protein
MLLMGLQIPENFLSGRHGNFVPGNTTCHSELEMGLLPNPRRFAASSLAGAINGRTG